MPVPQAPCQQYHLLDGSLLGKGWEDMASDHDVQDLFSYLPVDTEGPLYKEMLWQGGSFSPLPLISVMPVTRGLAETTWISKAESACTKTVPGDVRLEK